MEFADGSLIFLAFLLIGFVGVVIGYFTEKGSGIMARPYNKIYSGAPGAKGPGSVSGRDDRVQMRDWSRGAR
jgi:hypothetical protein